MTFANPFAWVLPALLVVPILLYLLPMPRRRADQPSLMLWRKMLKERPASQSWRWLRTLLSFLLEAAILVLLVLAVGKPVFGPGGGEADTVVVVLDASASMKAPVSPGAARTRFERARSLARDIVSALPSGRRVAVVAAESVPRVVSGLTAERAAVLRRLDAQSGTDRPGDLVAAVRTAIELVEGEPDAEVCLISDGGADLSGLALGKARLRWLRVGESLPNAGIVACRARRTFENPDDFEALVRVENASGEARAVDLRIAMDDNVIDTRPLKAAAGATALENFTGRVRGSGRLTASLEPGDAFPLDDRAVASLGTSLRMQVVLVSDVPDRFLESALTANRGIDSFLANLTQYLEKRPQPDVLIFSGCLPPELPSGNLLILNPPNATSLFQLAGDLVTPKIVEWRRDHPVFADVTLKDVYVPSAKALKATTSAETLIESDPDGSGLMLAWSSPERRVIALGFDPGSSSLSFRVAFPVLMANAFAWLTRSGGPPAPDTNLADARESDLRVPAKLVFADGEVAGRDGRAGGPGELWLFAAVAAFALVAVEWYLFHHRITV